MMTWTGFYRSFGRKARRKIFGLNPNAFVLRVESTSFCNQSCLFCPQNRYPFRNRLMSFKQYACLIDVLHDAKIPISKINFGGMGEPLTDPLLFKKAKYGRKITDNFSIYTNGKLFSEANLVDADRYLTKVFFSFHGNSPKEYEYYTSNDFEEMKKKLWLAKESLGDKLVLSNHPEGKLSDELGMPATTPHPIHNWDDDVLKESMKAKGIFSGIAGHKYCELAQFILVRVNGSFSSCCIDWNCENGVLDRRFPKCERCYSHEHYLDLQATGKIESFIGLLQMIQGKIKKRSGEHEDE